MMARGTPPRFVTCMMITAGTQFDAAAVQALALTIPTFRHEDHRVDPAVARAGRKTGVVSFPRG